MIVQILQPLKILDSLYLKGYPSSLIDRSLTKIIELEKANIIKQASELQSKLQVYDIQYQMRYLLWRVLLWRVAATGIEEA